VHQHDTWSYSNNMFVCLFICFMFLVYLITGVIGLNGKVCVFVFVCVCVCLCLFVCVCMCVCVCVLSLLS